MEKAVDERIELIKKLAYPIKIQNSKTGETLHLVYNKSTKKFVVSITSSGNKVPVFLKDGLSEKDVAEYLDNPLFSNQFNNCFTRIRKQANDYGKLRRELMGSLKKSRFSNFETHKMKEIIFTLTDVPAFSGGSGKVDVRDYVDNAHEIKQYLKVGNEYDRRMPIGVQLFTKHTSLNSTPYTKYRKITFSEMYSILKTFHILDDPKDKGPDYDEGLEFEK